LQKRLDKLKFFGGEASGTTYFLGGFADEKQTQVTQSVILPENESWIWKQ